MAKLHLDENFDNVQVEVPAFADPVFVNANKEHDENKENYEAAMEANEEATEGLTPEEGESIEVDKRDVLKKMHLEESLFSEPTPFDIRNRIEFMNSIDEIRDYCDQYPEIDYEFTDKEIRVYLDDNFVTSKYLDELYESLNEEVEDNKKDLYDAYLTTIREEQNNSNADMSPYSVLKTLRDKRTGWDSFVDDWATDFNLNIEDARAVMICALDAFLDGSLDEDFKKGDKFKNQNNATIEILDADDNDVTYEVKSESDPIGDARRTTPESMEVVIDKNGYEKISESMEEIDRQVFGSLNKETREPGVYYVLVDQNFDRKIYADSDEEAIEKFRAQLNESLDVDGSLTDKPEFYIDGSDIIDGNSKDQYAIANVIDDGSIVIRKNLSRDLTDEEKNKILNFVHKNYAEDAEILEESFNHFESDSLEERKRIVRLMHETMQSMQDEEAYFEWIYTMPDEPNEDDFEWFAEDDEEYKELVDAFNRIIKRYGKDGLFDPSDEVVEFTKNNGFELKITRPEIEEEYDPDLGGDTEDYKLDVESIKKALNGLQFGTLRAEGLVDEFIDTLENWMPLDESLNESLIYNVAKEQLKRFNEGKMGDSWNPQTYLERLASKKYLNEEQIKNLTESLNIKEENSLE